MVRRVCNRGPDTNFPRRRGQADHTSCRTWSGAVAGGTWRRRPRTGGTLHPHPGGRV